jgi:hypothetical protein
MGLHSFTAEIANISLFSVQSILGKRLMVRLLANAKNTHFVT